MDPFFLKQSMHVHQQNKFKRRGKPYATVPHKSLCLATQATIVRIV